MNPNALTPGRLLPTRESVWWAASIPRSHWEEQAFQLDFPALFRIGLSRIMRLRLSKNSGKLPISDDEVPLKTKENLEEYLQSAISLSRPSNPFWSEPWKSLKKSQSWRRP